MPLTALQSQVMQLIAANRSAASHFAGGSVLNASIQSPRFSHDFDIFHDEEDELVKASNQDLETLLAAGYTVQRSAGDWASACSFRKAQLTAGDEKLEIDWAVDSSFRFFPIQKDPVMGWRLHLFDLATNKALTLASRSVTRDYVDIVNLSSSYPLEAIIWAACGKDPGFTPTLLLEMMKRFARVNPRQLETIQALQLDPIQLKQQWIEISERAEAAINHLADTQPDLPIGVAFLDKEGQPRWIGTDPSLIIHHPSEQGSWPKGGGAES